jgi:hypothetical protein
LPKTHPLTLEEKSGVSSLCCAASFGAAEAQTSPVKTATARSLLRELKLSMPCSRSHPIAPVLFAVATPEPSLHASLREAAAKVERRQPPDSCRKKVEFLGRALRETLRMLMPPVLHADKAAGSAAAQLDARNSVARFDCK